MVLRRGELYNINGYEKLLTLKWHGTDLVNIIHIKLKIWNKCLRRGKLGMLVTVIELSSNILCRIFSVIIYIYIWKKCLFPKANLRRDLVTRAGCKASIYSIFLSNAASRVIYVINMYIYIYIYIYIRVSKFRPLINLIPGSATDFDLELTRKLLSAFEKKT